MNNKNLIIMQRGTMVTYMFHDLTGRADVDVYYVAEPLGNKVLNYARKVHTSIRLSRKAELPLKQIWYRKSLCNVMGDGKTVFFMLDAAVHIGKKNLRYLKKKYKESKFVLILLDSVNAHSWIIQYGKHYIDSFEWDLVLSYDEADCAERGFSYLGKNYYSRIETHGDAGENTDLYYIGQIKNEPTRMRLLEAIYKLSVDNQVRCCFKISGIDKKSAAAEGIRVMDSYMPYKDVVSEIQSANCILELVQPGQKSQTVRYMEAVCYNRKLLTNNRNIEELPFYNEKYMKFFGTAEDIDFDWVKEETDVDYGYNNEFSPVKIPELADGILKNK